MDYAVSKAMFSSLLARSSVLFMFALAPASAACSDPTSDGRLSLALDSARLPLVVQVGCASSCELPTLALSVSYDDGPYTARDTIELLQFRIDYDVAGSNVEIPYYAGTVSVVLRPADVQSLTLPAAGAAQREAAGSALGAVSVTSATGSARLQLAGYDWDNRHVFVGQDFDVRFDNQQERGQTTDAQTSQ